MTATSTEPVRQVTRIVKEALERQAELLYPVKPRMLFSALGEGTPSRSPAAPKTSASRRR